MLYLKELRKHIKSTIILILSCTLLLLWAFVEMKSYEGTDSMNEIIQAFPKVIQAVLGLNGYDLASVSGTFGMTWFYVIIVYGCYAIYLGSNITSKKKDLDYEYVMPVSKTKILLTRSLAILTIFITNTVLLLLSVVLAFQTQNTGITSYVIVALYQLFGVLLFTFGIGALIGALKLENKVASGISLMVILVFYVLSTVVIMFDNEYLLYLSPISAAINPGIIDGNLEIIYFIVNILLGICLFIVALFFYRKKDLQ